MDGVAYAELAERMGLAQATVRVRMFHCIKEVRKMIEAEDRRAGGGPG